MVGTDLSALSFKIDGVLPASTPDLASARVTCRVVSAPYLSRAFHQEKAHAKARDASWVWQAAPHGLLNRDGA
jgi:hypothetical protein